MRKCDCIFERLLVWMVATLVRNATDNLLLSKKKKKTALLVIICNYVTKQRAQFKVKCGHPIFIGPFHRTWMGHKHLQ